MLAAFAATAEATVTADADGSCQLMTATCDENGFEITSTALAETVTTRPSTGMSSMLVAQLLLLLSTLLVLTLPVIANVALLTSMVTVHSSE